MTISFGLTDLVLLPDRAVYLPETRVLVVADLHLGKSATFRTRGLAVPEGTTASDLSRLSKLLEQTSARTLVIAGDLIHSHDGLTPEIVKTFRDWLKKHNTSVILAEGNHDQRTNLARHQLPLEIRPECLVDETLITHDPDELHPDQFGIAGHLHPGIRIPESRHSSLRLSAFYLRNNKHLVLPAFSSFTGLQIIKPSPSDRFFVCLKETITEIPVSLVR
jgi:DNA ligase-associated metallophosphoesterase